MRTIADKRWIQFRELNAFVRLLVWAHGLKTEFKLFHSMNTRIKALWRNSGRSMTVQYLKEATKMTVMFIAHTPYTPSSKGVRVARSRASLPLLIPKELRRSFLAHRHGCNTAADWVRVRAVITLLSVYRSIGLRPQLKLHTILDTFTGLGQTLSEGEIRTALDRLRITNLRLSPSSWKMVSESAGPNYSKATWGSILDAAAFLSEPRVAWSWAVLAMRTKSYVLLAWLVWCILTILPVAFVLAIKKGPFPYVLGRLSKLHEANGKVRVVAVTDWWTQALLRPLHDELYRKLSSLDQDGTFHQTRPLMDLVSRRPEYGDWKSFDLSAATDRLPVALQVQVLRALGHPAPEEWKSLLTERIWWLGRREVKYSVGQPMGAYSSWAMLALTHHVIVQVAALRAGWQGLFPHYAVLGDDVVIAHEKVAESYLNLMAFLGVPINLSKTLSAKGTLEFAKRWVHADLGEFSPLGSNVLLGCIRNLRMLPMLIVELVNKGHSIYPSRVRELLAKGAQRRKKSSQGLLALSLLALGPSGGPWKRGQLSCFQEAWISLFPGYIHPKITIEVVHEALLRATITKVNRVLEARALARDTFWKEWARYSVLGTSLARGALSVPYMLIAPGFWAHLQALQETPGGSFTHGIPGSIDFATLGQMTQEVLGDLSSLSWNEREQVTDFLAGQELLLKSFEEVRAYHADALERARTKSTINALSKDLAKTEVTRVP